jgi:type VI secretion system protein VasD
VFELANNAQFSSADYFALIGQGGVPLGKEMLTSEEYVLMPGEVKVTRKRLMPTSRYLGVVAGYNRLNGRVWRAIAPLPAPCPAGQEQGDSASPARRLFVMLRERGVLIHVERPESGGKQGNDSN